MHNTNRGRSTSRAAATTERNSLPQFQFEDAHSLDSTADTDGRSQVDDYLLPNARNSWLSTSSRSGSRTNLFRPADLAVRTSHSRSRSRSRSISGRSGLSSGVSVPGSPSRFADALSPNLSSNKSSYQDAVDYDDSYIANVTEDVLELKQDLKNALGNGDNQQGSWLAAPAPRSASRSNNSSKVSLITGEETYELHDMRPRSPAHSALHLEIPQSTAQPQYSPRPDTVEGVFREFTTKINNIRHQRSPNRMRPEQERFSFYDEEAHSFAPPSVASHDPEPQAHPLILYGKSLKIFPPYSEFRNSVAKRLENPIYTYAIRLLLLLQTIVLVYRQWNPAAMHGYIEFGRTWADWVLLVINIVYTVEIIAKCVAWGFWDDSEMFKAMDMDYTPLIRMLKLDILKSYFLGNDEETEEYKKAFKHSMTFKSTSGASKGPIRRAFMRNSWNRVDFISTVCFWINFFLSIKRTNAVKQVPLFRALECLRIIRLVNMTDRISLILKSIKNGAPQLTDVVLFILYFWTLFAIIGTQSFKSSYRRYCFWTDPNDSSNVYQSEQHCGGYLIQNANGTVSHTPYITSDGVFAPSAKGYLCPVNSQCLELENPEKNMYSFDNILNAMQLTFVIMSANTFSNIMYDMMNTDTMAASIYFIFGIFVLFLWMINLLVAVINAAFKATREAEIKENQDFKEDFDLSYNMPEWWLSKSYYVASRLADTLSMVAICIACTITKNTPANQLAMERYSQDIISAIFLVEILWRFVCYRRDWRAFFKVNRNLFDLFLAVVTGAIAIPVVQVKMGRGYDWMRAFISLRFYRFVVRIPYVRTLWAKVWRNINIIMNLSFFYFLFLFLCSVIFARYWEGVIPADEIDDNQFPMNTLPNAFLALFVITTTENWTEIMYTMQSAAANKAAALFGALLFIAWFIFSNSIILSIFIAVIGDSLEVSEKIKRKAQVKKFILVDFPNKLKQLAEGTVLQQIRERFFGSEDTQEQKHREIEKLLLNGAAVQAFLRDEVEHEVADDFDDQSDDFHTLSHNVIIRFFQLRYRHVKHSKIVRDLRGDILWHAFGGKDNPFFSKSKFSPDSNYISLAEKFQIETEKTIEARKKFLKENPSFNTALYVLRPNQPLRRLCQRITKPSSGKRYDGVEPSRVVNAIFVGIISAATLALVIIACYSTPLYRNSQGPTNSRIWYWTLIVETTFGILFSIEFWIKIIADGFWYTPNAYARNTWNRIDLVVLISIWINVFAIVRGDENLSRIVRGLKALRALRILTISETSKDIFQKVLVAGVWKILSAALLSSLLIWPFAAWGLFLFTGRLGACNDNSLGIDDCVSEFTNTVFKWDIMMPRAYVEPQLELNRYASALLTLFEILSMEGWTDLLENMVNSTGVGTPPGYYATPANAIFVVLFLFVGIVFVLTLFVSVIIKNYAMLSGSAFLTLQQTSWNEVHKLLAQARPRKRPDTRNLNTFRMFCYRYSIQRPRWLEVTMHAILWIHVLAIMLEKYPTDNALDSFRYGVFICSSTFFLVTILMRLVALGAKTFFKVRWNIYELFIFLGAFGTSCTSFFVSRSTAFPNVNKLFLVGIFTILIYQSHRLSHLLKIASASVPPLLSLIFTWGVLLLVYAIALNQIFGLTRLGPNTDNNQNLRTVTKSMILLFKISFGENWNYTMRDFAIESPYCVNSGVFSSTDCGNMQYAYILFISWNILSMYIFVNMFVSLIFENFSYVYTDNAGSISLSREEIRKFKSVWAKFDPDGTGYISEEQLPCLLRTLSGYFSFHMFEGHWSVKELKENFFGKRELEGQRGLYDVDVDIHGLNRLLSQLDVEKARARKLKYDRFIEEAKFNMERHEERGISFQRLILQIPLYSRFDENNCLTLTDFLDRLVVSRKLSERLAYRRRLDTLKMISCRWRYLRATGRKFSSVVPHFQPPNLFNEMDKAKSPFMSQNPFLTPRSSMSKTRADMNETYWSPVNSDSNLVRSDTDVMEELANISGALGHSQWKAEFKSIGDEIDEVMSRSDVDGHRGKKAKDDPSSDEDEVDFYKFVFEEDDQKGSQSERKIT